MSSQHAWRGKIDKQGGLLLPPRRRHRRRPPLVGASDHFSMQPLHQEVKHGHLVAPSITTAPPPVDRVKYPAKRRRETTKTVPCTYKAGGRGDESYLWADDRHGREEALYRLVADQAVLVGVAEFLHYRQCYACLLPPAIKQTPTEAGSSTLMGGSGGLDPLAIGRSGTGRKRGEMNSEPFREKPASPALSTFGSKAKRLTHDTQAPHERRTRTKGFASASCSSLAVLASKSSRASDRRTKLLRSPSDLGWTATALSRSAWRTDRIGAEGGC